MLTLFLQPPTFTTTFTIIATTSAQTDDRGGNAGAANHARFAIKILLLLLFLRPQTLLAL